jgi:hypothetical protein
MYYRPLFFDEYGHIIPLENINCFIKGKSK